MYFVRLKRTKVQYVMSCRLPKCIFYRLIHPLVLKILWFINDPCKSDIVKGLVGRCEPLIFIILCCGQVGSHPISGSISNMDKTLGLSSSPISQQTSGLVSSSKYMTTSSRRVTHLRVERQELLTGLKTPRRPAMGTESNFAVPMEGLHIPDTFSKVLAKHLIPFGMTEKGDLREPPHIPSCLLLNVEVVRSL